MKYKIIKKMSVFLVLLILSSIFVPVAMANADKQVQEDTDFIRNVLGQKSFDIQNKYGVSKLTYSESDFENLEHLVLIFLKEQNIYVTNLDIKNLVKYASKEHNILSGSISFEIENIKYDLDIFTHNDFENSFVEIYSKEGNNYKYLKVNKNASSEETVNYDVKQIIINNGISQSFYNKISYPVENIYDFSKHSDEGIFTTGKGTVVYPPSSPPPGIGATLVNRVQLSQLFDASAVASIIAAFIPGGEPIAIMSAAITLLDIFSRRGLNVDTDRTYVRIKTVSPPFTGVYIAPWPAVGVGVAINIFFGCYLEVTEYYIL